MRIAFVSPYDFSYPGGVAKHITNLNNRLRQMGHQTCIIAPTSHDVASVPREVACPSRFVVPVRCGGSLARVCLSPLMGLRVRRMLQHQQFDVLHLHEPTNPTLPQAVLRHSGALTPGTAIVGTFHAYQESKERGRLGHLLDGTYRSLCRRAAAGLDARIAVSVPAREYASRTIPGPYQVIPNGVDTTLFGNPFVEPLDEFREGLNILFVGRAEPRKGLGYLLEAYARVKNVLPEARLLVVGPNRPAEVRSSPRWQGAVAVGDVHVLGCLPEQELARTYRTSHVFCAPSTGCESFGMVLLEAMAAGVPVVASDIEGYRAVLNHGAEGFLVRPRDPCALADALLRLLRCPELRRSMGQRGQATAARYAWDGVVAAVLDCYAAVLERKRAGVRFQPCNMHSRPVDTLVEQAG
jgi:phosphatidylinositol alpha-mannosyltransferase